MQPLRDKSQGQKAQVGSVAKLPAPTAGWYVGDNQAQPPPKTAIVLNNAFPQLDYVRIRGGSAAWATGMGSSFSVNSLLVWLNSDDVTAKMFAVANNSIYDVTNSGVVGAALVTGLASSYLDGIQFKGLGGTYLVCVDGVDPVQIFDGTGWNRTFSYTGTFISGSPLVWNLSGVAGLQVGMAMTEGAGDFPAGTSISGIVGTTPVITQTGTIAATTPNVTGMPNTTGILPGMAVSGTGITAGTTVLTVAPTSLVLSANTTASGAETLSFYATLTMSANATASATETLKFYQNAPITGVTDSALSAVWSYKGRLYFAGASSMNCWYLGLNAIGGAATLLPLAPYFTLGGSLLCGATWSINSIAGSFLAVVFISTEGEVLMFNGDYPGASNWNLQGSYKVSRPLGKRCLMKAGGDLLIMTEDGIVPMSKVETLDQVALQNVAATKPIAPAWRLSVLARAGLAGWQIVNWPIQTMTIINLPKVSTTDFTQYVVNSRTGAWAQYLGWDANCFAVFQNQLFYGTSNGRVLQGETGGADDSINNYTMTMMLAFSDLGAPSVTKEVYAVRPYVLSAQTLAPSITINVDYDTTVPLAPSPASAYTGAKWDSALWDSGLWGGALLSQTQWYDANGEGSAIAVNYQITMNAGANTPDVRIAAFDVLYQKGNVFG